MIVDVPIDTWLTLFTDILTSSLRREGIPIKEYGITSKVSHQSAIPLLHIAQLFRQISDLFALDINLELLEASKLYRKFTRDLIVLKADIHKIIRCDGIRQEISRYFPNQIRTVGDP